MKISIIVPIYNVEKYISKCIDSIINQTYRDLEIILVDDGSPDKCGIICDKYASFDKRIIVIHKQNGGLSSARNAGLDVATGSYVGFVDSDDWIESTMYEEMISMFDNDGVDLVECGINLISDRSIKLYEAGKNEIISGHDALFMHLDLLKRGDQTMPRTAVWSKLFRKDFWNDRRFPNGKIHEDYMLTVEALYYANKVALVKKGLLNHLIDNPCSIVNTRFSSRDLFKETQLKNRIYFLNQHNSHDLESLARADYYNYLVSAVWRCDQNGMMEKWNYVKIIRNGILRIPFLRLSFLKKTELLFIALFPHLYMYLRRQKK